MNSTVYSFDIDFIRNSQTEEHGAHDTIACLPGVCHTDDDDFVRYAIAIDEAIFGKVIDIKQYPKVVTEKGSLIFFAATGFGDAKHVNTDMRSIFAKYFIDEFPGAHDVILPMQHVASHLGKFHYSILEGAWYDD